LAAGILTVPMILAVTMVGVGCLGAAGRLRYGHWAGLRLPSTLRSRRAWEAAHRAGAAGLIAGGAGGVLAAGLLRAGAGGVFGERSRLVLLAEGGFTLVATLIGRRAARAAEPPADAPHPNAPPADSPPNTPPDAPRHPPGGSAAARHGRQEADHDRRGGGVHEQEGDEGPGTDGRGAGGEPEAGRQRPGE
jgi:hypothetical protein